MPKPKPGSMMMEQKPIYYWKSFFEHFVFHFFLYFADDANFDGSSILCIETLVFLVSGHFITDQSQSKFELVQITRRILFSTRMGALWFESGRWRKIQRGTKRKLSGKIKEVWYHFFNILFIGYHIKVSYIH